MIKLNVKRLNPTLTGLNNILQKMYVDNCLVYKMIDSKSNVYYALYKDERVKVQYATFETLDQVIDFVSFL